MPKKRGKTGKKVAPVFHIFCEGEKTEPYYINDYINYFHSEHRNIVVVEKTKKNTPVQLVDAAIKERSNTNDIYWVVFDRESIAKYPHELHSNARKKAKDNNISIALSNVCFELWFLLHFNFSTASYDSCKNLLDKSPLKESLKKSLEERGIKDYEKGLPHLFDILKYKVVDAIQNAEKLKKEMLKSSSGSSLVKLNPYTDVHELFIDIKNFIDGNDSIRSNQTENQRKTMINETIKHIELLSK